MKAHGLMPFDMAHERWRDPKYMYFAGGKDKADKKKRMHGWLREAGFTSPASSSARPTRMIRGVLSRTLSPTCVVLSTARHLRSISRELPKPPNRLLHDLRTKKTDDGEFPD